MRSFLNGALAVLGAIFGPIRRALEAVVDGVVEALEWLKGRIDDAFAGLKWLGDAANAVIASVRDGLLAAIRSAVDGALAVIGVVRDWLVDRIADAAAIAQGLFDQAIDFAARLALRVEQKVVDLGTAVAGWIARAVDRAVELAAAWVRDNVVPWFGQLLDELDRRLDAVRDWLVEQIGKAVSWLLDRLAPYLAVLDQAWSWLLLLARNPVSWFVDQLTELADRAPRLFVGALLRTVASERATVERHLARWLGAEN